MYTSPITELQGTEDMIQHSINAFTLHATSISQIDFMDSITLIVAPVILIAAAAIYVLTHGFST